MAREMKSSGVEWIGDIPADWEIRKNKTLFNCSKRIIGSASGQTQLLSLTTQGIKTKSQDSIGGKTPETFDTYQRVEQNDIVMCLFDLDCSAVFSGISPYTGMISPAYKVIKCKNNLFPKYANYWFMFIFDGRKFKSYAKNLRYTLNYDEFALLPIVLPSYYDQQIVARFLDKKCAEIDAVIEKTKATIEEYKKLKQSVITEAVTKGIRGDRPMKDSGYEFIGEIPNDWDVCRLRNIGTPQNGISKGGEFFGKGYPFVNYGDVYRNYSLPETIAGLVESTEEERERYSVKAGDIFFTRTSETIEEVGFSSVCEKDIPDATFAGFLIRVRPFTDDLYLGYSKYYFRSNHHRIYLVKEMNLVTRASLGQDLLKSMPVLVPPMDEQKEIADYLDKKCAEIDLLIAKKKNLLNELENYKKSLIYEYVTGKKECREIIKDTSENICPCFPAVLNASSPRFAQAVLMSKILDECSKNIGSVKLEKMLFTIEYYIGFNFDTEYVREVAGPLDASLYKSEAIISKKNKWYIIDKSKRPVSYIATKNKNKYKKYYDRYFAEYDAEINRIIDIFKPYTKDQAEIIATLFAAWNDAIIDGKNFSDEDIVNDVLNNWNDSKKRFSKEVWLRALDTMRKNNLIPKGYGKKTVIKGKTV